MSYVGAIDVSSRLAQTAPKLVNPILSNPPVAAPLPPGAGGGKSAADVSAEEDYEIRKRWTTPPAKSYRDMQNWLVTDGKMTAAAADALLARNGVAPSLGDWVNLHPGAVLAAAGVLAFVLVRMRGK